MGIRKQYTLGNGVTAEYFRLVSVGIERDFSVGEVGFARLELYFNQAAKQADKPAVVSLQFSVPPSLIKNGEEGRNLFQSVYRYLKNNELVGGEDV